MYTCAHGIMVLIVTKQDGYVSPWKVISPCAKNWWWKFTFLPLFSQVLYYRYSGAPGMHEACKSRESSLWKFGYLSMQEILVVTWPYIHLSVTISGWCWSLQPNIEHPWSGHAIAHVRYIKILTWLWDFLGNAK